MNTAPFAMTGLTRMCAMPAIEAQLLLRLLHFVLLQHQLLPLDAERCYGIAAASARADRELCDRVLAEHFVITELGRRPGPGLLVLPGGTRLDPAVEATPGSRQGNAGVTPGVTDERVTERVTAAVKQQRYRARVERLHSQALALGLSPLRKTSLSELQRMIEEAQEGNASVTPASPQALPPSRARADLLNTNTSISTSESERAVTPGAAGSAAGAIAAAMKRAGMAQLNPSNPHFRTLVDAGAGQELVDAVREFPGKPFAYVLAVVEGRRRDAAAKPAVPAKQASSLERWAGPEIAAMLNGGRTL